MKIDINFPRNYPPDTEKAIVATSLCRAASAFIKLPEKVIVEFVDLGPGIYGESTLYFNQENRIRINLQLSKKELIYPLVHELLHLNQIHEGRLAITRFGECVWESKVYKLDQAKMSYNDYKQLPWELDVATREKELLVKILK
jgi:hypothetical protein